MKVESNISLHNRFDIEVRDAVTGELKQEAKAFNIILNKMWDVLCAGGSYFSYIQFGTGAGTPVSTRTTLFTYLNKKTAINDELIKAIPNSSWKRKIVINPEEFVGSVLTEVGIESQSNGLVTHAMLQDSEGNPISITKTATDVITIYATVYVTFGSENENITYVGMPNNNALVNYLIGGGSFPSQNKFQAGSGINQANEFASGLESYSLGSTAANITWVSDIPNKRRKTSIGRFGTTDANGHIKEIIYPYVFRMLLPADGIFSGQPYVDVPIATGDGIESKYLLPSKNIKQETIAMKLNGGVTSALQKELVNKGINYWMPDLVGYNTGYSLYGFAVTQDASRVFMYYNISNSIIIVDRVGTAWIKSDETIPCTSGYGLACTLDGQTLVVAIYGGSKVYDRSPDGEWIQRGPAICTAAVGQYYPTISNDGTMVSLYVALSGSPGAYYFYTSTNGENFAYRGQLYRSTYPEFKITDDGRTRAVKTNVGTVLIEDWNGTEWVLRSTLTLSTNYFDISGDGSVVVGIYYLDGTYYIKGYKWNGSSWDELFFPDYVPSSNVANVRLSKDGSRFYYSINAAISQNELSGNTYHFIGTQNLSSLVNASQALFTDVDTHGAFFIVNNQVLIANIEPTTTEITFDTPPASGVAITSNYTVNGVHKTDQYVIDVGFSIQFGEPT